MGCCCTKSQKSVQELKSLSYAVHSAQPQDQAPVCPDVKSGQNPSGHDVQKGKEHKYPRGDQASATKTSGSDVISGQNPSGHDVQKGKEHKYPRGDQAQKSVPEFKSLCDTVPSAQRQDQEPMRRHDVRLEQEQSRNDAQPGQKDKRHHPDQRQQNVGFGQEQSRNDVQHGQNDNHHPDQVRHKEEIKQLNDKIQELSRNLEDHQKRNIALEKETEELRISRRGELIKQLNDKIQELSRNLKDHQKREINLIQKNEKLTSRNIALEKEIEELRIRLSSLISAKLMDGNPEITDLSDPNRPTKIAEMYSELYDNAWTDAFDVLSKKESEETAIGILLDILLISYKASSNSVKEKWNNFNQKMESSKLDRNTLDLKRKEKNNLKKNFKFGQESIRQPILDEIQKQVKLPAKIEKDSIIMEYIDQVVKITWLMAVQDPMVYMENKIVRGKPWDKNKYKEYTKRGDTIDFVVWPPLLLHEGGPLLMKGVAQGKQHNRTLAEDGKQIGGATHVEDTFAATNESFKGKGIAAQKPGNDPELSSNGTAGDVGSAVYEPDRTVELSELKPGDATKHIDRDRDKKTAKESHGGKVNVKQGYKAAERQGKDVEFQASISQRTSATFNISSLQSMPKRNENKKSDESIKTIYQFNKNSSEVNSNSGLGEAISARHKTIKTADPIDKKPATEPAIKDQGKTKTENPSGGKVKVENGLAQKNDQHRNMTEDRWRESEVPQSTTYQQISSVNQGQSKVTDNENPKPTNRTVIGVSSASRKNTAKAVWRNTVL